jgi:transposase
MQHLGFATTQCLPRHAFTKGRAERLVRYMKDNFLPACRSPTSPTSTCSAAMVQGEEWVAPCGIALHPR